MKKPEIPKLKWIEEFTRKQLSDSEQKLERNKPAWVDPHPTPSPFFSKKTNMQMMRVVRTTEVIEIGYEDKAIEATPPRPAVYGDSKSEQEEPAQEGCWTRLIKRCCG